MTLFMKKMLLHLNNWFQNGFKCKSTVQELSIPYSTNNGFILALYVSKQNSLYLR